MTKRTIRRIQIIARVVAALGLLLILGTVGAADMGSITMHQFWHQGIAGVIMLGSGCLFGGLIR